MIKPDGTSLAKVHHDVGPFVDKSHVAQRRLGNGHERQDHHNGEDEPREGIMLEIVHKEVLRGSKGSRGSRGSRGSKGSKGSRGSKG